MLSSDALFSYFIPYESQEMLRRFLVRTYEQQPSFKEKATKLSYQNAATLHYEWMIGKTYWQEGMLASFYVQPLLYFYGMTHFLKGIILLNDPYYPANSDVLAHGVTSRKRKKKGYSFLEDEVKVQKRGFFPHFSKELFHVEHVTGEKWQMGHLLYSLPHMQSLMQQCQLANFSSLVKKLHPLAIHFLLLYNLSMICRYEAEWWGELLTLSHGEDYPVVKHYLMTVAHQVPPLFQPFFMSG